MKRIATLFTAAALAAPLFAQEKAMGKKEMSKEAAPMQVTVVQPVLSPEMIKEALTQDRRTLFEAAMADLLTDEAKKQGFWDIYASYEKERAGLMDRTMNNLSEYVNKFTTLTDKQVNELLKTSMKIQGDSLAIRNKYTNMLSAKVNPMIAGRFYQVDGFIQSAVQIGVLSNIPLLGEKVQ